MTETIVVVGPDGPEPRPRPGLRTVRDPEPFGGPLIGLDAGLAATSTEVAVVLGGDMPLVRPAVLEAMLVALREPGTFSAERDHPPDAVVLADAVTRSPLPLALAVEAAHMRVFVARAAGQRSLQALLDRLEVRTLSQAEWRPLDPDGDSLVDVDSPEDLERVRASDPGGRGLP